MNTRKLIEWKCVPSLMLYCCNILDGIDVSLKTRSIVVRIPFVKCIMTGDGIFSC